MSFKVGEKVVYPAHGVGVIESIQSKSIGGTERKFYMLRFLESDMTIMVPTENVDTVGLRRIIGPKLDVWGLGTVLYLAMSGGDVLPGADDGSWDLEALADLASMKNVGALPDERKFGDIREFQKLAAAGSTLLLKNLARQLAIYATGHDLAFSDREQIANIVARTQKQGGGVRTLLHELTQSQLFQTR